jgi:multiple sugar transport system permease protein
MVPRDRRGNVEAATSTRSRALETLGSERVRESFVGYAFVLLPVTLFGLFFIWPIIHSFYISAHQWGALVGKEAYIGAENYRTAFDDDIFRRALKNTALFAITVVPLQMALGLVMALAVNQGLRGRTFFRSAFYFPSLTSAAAIVAIAVFIFSADGLVNSGLRGAGVGALTPSEGGWFSDSDTALWTIVGLVAWTSSGTMMLFYLASLQAIPTDVYEAAAIDGSGTWRTFWKITFPLLKPAHFFVGVVSMIGALKIFDQAYIASSGSGGPAYATLTAVLYLYQTAIGDFDFGYAAALGAILFVIIFTLTLIQRLLFGRAEIGY